MGIDVLFGYIFAGIVVGNFKVVCIYIIFLYGMTI